MKKQTMRQLRLGMAVLALCGMSAVGGGQTFAKETIETLTAKVTELQTQVDKLTKNNTVVLGTDAEATSPQGIAIGYGANAKNSNSFSNGIAIGVNALAYNNGATGIGGGVFAAGWNSVALGTNATTTIQDTVAIGYGSGSTAKGSIALGLNASAGLRKGVDYDIIKLYTYTDTNGKEQTVVQAYTDVTDQVNSDTTTSYDYTQTVDGKPRYYVKAAKSSSGLSYMTAIGANSVALASHTVATGSSSYASGNAAIASGYLSKALGDQSIAIGLRAWAGKTTTEEDDDTTLATGAKAANAIAIGNESKAYADNTIALGKSAKASGKQSIALGYSTTASEDDSVVVGRSSTASGKRSIALGYSTNATVDDGVAIGNGASVAVANAIALGQGSKVASGDGNVLSIGTKGNERKIIHVANGTDNYDAANYGQLLKTETYTLQSSNNYSVTLQTNNGANGPTIQIDTSDFGGTGGDVSGKANTSLNNITLEGKQNINNAFSITNGGDDSQVTVTPDTDTSTGVTTYTLDVKTDSALSETGTGLVTSGTVYNALEGKADTSLSNITDAGKTAVKDLAIAAVAVESGDGIKVSSNTDAGTTHKKTYTVALDYNYIGSESGVGGGTVTSNNTKLISGDTMYSELRPTANGHYVKSANLTSVNLLALDTAIGADADYDATSDSDLNVITKTNEGGSTNTSVKANLGKLDKALGKVSKLTAETTSVKGIDGKVIGSKVSEDSEEVTYTADLTGAVLAVNDKVGNLSTTKKHKISDGTEIDYYLLDATQSLAANMETLDQYLGDVNSLAGDTDGNGAMLDVSGNKVTTAQLATSGLTGVMLTMNAKIGDLPSKTGTGSYAYKGAIKYGASVNENLVNIDKAIGTTTDSKFLSSTASVGQNLTSLDTNKANQDLDNLTAKGTNTLKDLARDAVTVTKGDGIKVITTKTDTDSAHSTDYQISLDYDAIAGTSGAGGGAVASGDKKLVSGGTMYAELRPTTGSYVNSTNTTAKNLEALDAAIGGNDDYGTGTLNVITKTNDHNSTTSVKANLGALDKAMGKVSALTDATNGVKGIDGKVIGSTDSDGEEGSKYSADLTGAVLAVNDKVGNLSTDGKHKDADGNPINSYHLLDGAKSLAENMETVDQYLGNVKSLAGDSTDAIKDKNGKTITAAELAKSGLTGVMLTMNAKIGDLPSKTGTGSYAYGGAIQYGASVNENLVNIDKAIGTDADYGDTLHNITKTNEDEDKTATSVKANLGKLDAAIGTTNNGTHVSATNSVGENLNALDTAIGTTTTGAYVNADKSVGVNLNALDSHLSTLSNKVDTLTTDKANRDMDNLTAKGENQVKDLAREAVTVAKGEGISVEKTTDTDGHSTNYKISIDYATLNYDTIAGASGVGGGAVASGDKKLVSGETMYSELRPTDGSYIKNGNSTAENLNALDAAIGADSGYGTKLNNISTTTKYKEGDVDKERPTTLKENIGALDKAMGKVSDLTNTNTGVKGIDGKVIGGESSKYTADLTGAVQAVNDKVGNLSTDNTHKDAEGTEINSYHLLDSVKSLAANMETVDQYLGDVKSLAGDGDDAIKDKDGKAITTETLANGGLASVMKTMDAKIGDLPSTENYAYKGAIKSGVSVNDNLVNIDKAIGTDEDYGSELYNISTGDNVSLKKNIGALDAAIGTTADGAFVSSTNSVGQNLNALDRGLSDLGDRVNKVGAGAAALSALHVQDFDPDNKLNFAVGFGHYKNANAGAIGAFYKPNHDTTFSIASTIGNGDNMLNAGISFKIGTSSHVEKTMVVKADYEALQKKVADQDKRLAAQDERLASQDAQIEELKKQVAALIARG